MVNLKCLTKAECSFLTNEVKNINHILENYSYFIWIACSIYVFASMSTAWNKSFYLSTERVDIVFPADQEFGSKRRKLLMCAQEFSINHSS